MQEPLEAPTDLAELLAEEVAVEENPLTFFRDAVPGVPPWNFDMVFNQCRSMGIPESV